MFSSIDAASDPVLLAHLGAASIGLIVDPALLAERRTELPLDLSGRQQRLANIADGIVYCAVQKPQDEVIGVNVNLGKDQIVVLVAGNDPVSATTIQHVSEMWECLVQISAAVDQEAGGSGGLEQITPEANHELSEIEPVRKLQHLVYRFCYAKFRKTFNKWNKGIKTFGGKIRDQGFMGNPGPDGTIVTQMLQILEFFAAISRLLATGQGQLRYDVLSTYMDGASTLAQCVLTNPMGGAHWEGPDLGNFLTALEKCTSLHRHMECLIRCARSTRLRPWFQKRCKVRPCPEFNMSTPSWPQSPTSWLELTGELLDQKAHAKCVEKIAATANHRCSLKVHAELQVALLLLAERPPTTQFSFAYIGVSKLSCGPCKIFLEALNTVRGANLAVRRTHAKWYPGWGMPSDQVLTTVLTAEELIVMKECLVERMKMEILSFVTAADKKNVRISDSTDQSLDSRHRRPQQFKVARANQQLLAENDKENEDKENDNKEYDNKEDDDEKRTVEPALHDVEGDFLQPGFLISLTVVALIVCMWSSPGRVLRA